MNNRNLRLLILKFSLAAAPLFMTGPIAAANVAINTADASGWILENYTPGPVVIWYTGAVCENGSQNLSFTSPTPGDLNRLWATVMAAKLTGKGIFVWYESRTCTISSFGLR